MQNSWLTISLIGSCKPKPSRIFLNCVFSKASFCAIENGTIGTPSLGSDKSSASSTSSAASFNDSCTHAKWTLILSSIPAIRSCTSVTFILISFNFRDGACFCFDVFPFVFVEFFVVLTVTFTLRVSCVLLPSLSLPSLPLDSSSSEAFDGLLLFDFLRLLGKISERSAISPSSIIRLITAFLDRFSTNESMILIRQSIKSFQTVIIRSKPNNFENLFKLSYMPADIPSSKRCSS